MANKRHFKNVSSELIEEGNNGFCADCGTIIEGGIEPDAREYECPDCSSHNGVYGLEEALLMGLIGVKDK